MDRRRQFRRARRSKLRYRPVRFKNRRASKRKNRYTPTLISKFQGHKREIELIKSILPIKGLILEVGEFFLTITNPDGNVALDDADDTFSNIISLLRELDTSLLSIIVEQMDEDNKEQGLLS